MSKLNTAAAKSKQSLRVESKISDEEGAEEGSVVTHEFRKITVTVESIENIVSFQSNRNSKLAIVLLDPEKFKEISVRIDFAGKTLSQSARIPIEDNRAEIQLVGSIDMEQVNYEIIDMLLSNPVLFTVYDYTPSSSTIDPLDQTSRTEKNLKTKSSKTSFSVGSGSKSILTSNKILGICNLDIGSIAMGEKRIKKTLIVESNKNLKSYKITSWVKLPKLVVNAVTGEEPLVLESQIRPNNVIGITVETVYNVPEHIPEGSTFDAVIQVPSLGDQNNRIIFPSGTTSFIKDSSCRKKWLTLHHLEGPGTRSNHRILSTFCDVTNTLPDMNLDLEDEARNTLKYMQWNTWKSSLMLKSDVDYFYSKIMKYRVWPIEIYFLNKSKENAGKTDKKSKSNYLITPSSADHFIAFLDLSSLLYPGITKTRVAAQLRTYSQAELINNFGVDSILWESAQGSTVNFKPTRVTSQKSKTSQKEDSKLISAGSIATKKGSPTFIVVEIELLKPFTLKRNPEYFETNLLAQVSIKGKIKKKITNLELRQENFAKSIKDAVQVLSEEHRRFSLASDKSYLRISEDFDVAFQKFLYQRENFQKIKNTLETKIVELINEKYGALDQYKKRIPEIYVYLVNEMHKITNNCVLGEENVLQNNVNADELQLYVEEALEEGNYNLAKEYLMLKLSHFPSNPDYWLDCAVCCIGINKFELAVEAVREALSLQFHHQMGLLLYALLMTRLNNHAVAEHAFEVLLTKYPRFIEGWMALGFFYSTINYSEGEFTAYQMAKKLQCEEKHMLENDFRSRTDSYFGEDKFSCQTFKHDCRYDPLPEGYYGMASYRDGVSWTEPLSWTTYFSRTYNVNLKILILFLKLGFYEYASMSLSQELLTSPNEHVPPFYMYYMAVNYYLHGSYDEAIPLLQSFVKEYGKDCFVWGLLGHCYYKLENDAKAIACYEYVMESYNRPDNIHLIYLRMGYYYIRTKKYACAKRVFTTACKYSPTPKLWKGLGIACLRTEEPDSAETALSEANYLDNRDPEVWAYLALTNAMMQKLDMFKCCYLEAKKRNLENVELLEEITTFLKLFKIEHEDF